MKFWNQHLKNLKPYIPGEQPKKLDLVIKLNTNENPYPPSPRVISRLEKIHSRALALYPEANWNTLRKALGQQYQINEDCIFCGNGSDEILSLIVRCFMSPGDEVVIPYPNYSLYETICQSYGIQYNYIQSDDNFIIPFDSLNKKPSRAVFFSNPNAPTGLYYDVELIHDFCKNYDGLFILDEAYIDFGGESGIKLVSELDNLIVLRTFSKAFSLAGIRLGYAFACPSLIEGLMRLKDSYNINYVSQVLACEAMQDYDYMRQNADDIIANRNYLTEELSDLGFDVLDSKTNFLFVKHQDFPAKEMYEKLKAKDILIRYFDHPRLRNHLRITVGKRGDLRKFLDETKTILQKVEQKV